jgi:hypothetical protein
MHPASALQISAQRGDALQHLLTCGFLHAPSALQSTLVARGHLKIQQPWLGLRLHQTVAARRPARRLH